MLLTMAHRLRDTFAHMRIDGTLPDATPRLRFGDYNRVVGLDELSPSAIDMVGAN